jgi:uncharacterized protein
MMRHRTGTRTDAAQDNPDSPAPAQEDKVRIVRCPGCSGDSLYASANAYRPFCSARCKGLDFGAWAGESFRLAAETDPDELAPPDAPLQ